MYKKSISDYSDNEIKYVINLLRRNTPLEVIRKKTHLTYNEILNIIKKFNIDCNINKYLSIRNFDTNKIGIISDTHIGNPKSNIRYIEKAYSYFLNNNIHTILHLGDLIQGPITPYKYSVEEQTKAILKHYPSSKIITTFILFGNHEYRAIEDGYDDILNSIFNRKDLKYLGTKEAYITWNNKLIMLEHFISKHYIDIPYKKPSIKISGHHHSYRVLHKNPDNIYVPTLSDDMKVNNEYPAFLVATLENNQLYIEKENIKSKIENQGLVYKKRL